MTYSQLKNVLQSVQQALASINDQEVELTLFIGLKPKHREGSWKALAEAHLRERVRNPHDYRALSIELEGMKNAGYDWREEFNYSIAQLTDFLNTLYGIRDLRSGILWNRIEYIPERYFYQIQDSTENWRRVSSKLISNHLQ